MSKHARGLCANGRKECNAWEGKTCLGDLLAPGNPDRCNHAAGEGGSCAQVFRTDRLLHAHPACSPPCLPRLQLAEIYEQAKEGMYAGSYVPAAMYSCGGHLAGPQSARRPTFASATA